MTEWIPRVDSSGRYVKQTRRPINPHEDKSTGSHIFWKQYGDQIMIAEKPSAFHIKTSICLYKEEFDKLVADIKEKYNERA